MVDGPPTPPLPPGWTERYTEAGSVYYWNPTSGETSWERPKFRPPVGTATVNPVHRGAPPTAPTAKNYEVKIAPRAGGWKRKAIIGAVVACAVTVVVVVAVLLMGSSGSSSASGTTTVQPEEGEDIFINGGSTVRMAVSDPGVLYVLEVVDEDGARTPVGRSYDGNAWEATSGGAVPDEGTSFLRTSYPSPLACASLALCAYSSFALIGSGRVSVISQALSSAALIAAMTSLAAKVPRSPTPRARSVMVCVSTSLAPMTPTSGTRSISALRTCFPRRSLPRGSVMRRPSFFPDLVSSFA